MVLALQAIVLGGGLAGVSAANTILELGGNVILLDKSSFCGGNSTKVQGSCSACPSMVVFTVFTALQLYSSDFVVRSVIAAGSVT